MQQMSQQAADEQAMQEQMKQMMLNLQMKDGLRGLNRLVGGCFDQCVTTYRTKKLESPEVACVDTCFKKYQEFQLLVQKSWQEENARINEQAQVDAQLAMEAAKE
jgi:import inner membrane translocase subunit TIM9